MTNKHKRTMTVLLIIALVVFTLLIGSTAAHNAMTVANADGVSETTSEEETAPYIAPPKYATMWEYFYSDAKSYADGMRRGIHKLIEEDASNGDTTAQWYLTIFKATKQGQPYKDWLYTVIDITAETEDTEHIDSNAICAYLQSLVPERPPVEDNADDIPWWKSITAILSMSAGLAFIVAVIVTIGIIKKRKPSKK